MAADVGYYRDLRSKVLLGRKVILAGVPVTGATGWVKAMRELGADRCFVIAPTFGTGQLPDPADADWIDLGITAADPVVEFRAFEKAMANPSAEVLAGLEDFDPERAALTLVDRLERHDQVAGRAAYGARHPEWVALEDKTIVDALWE